MSRVAKKTPKQRNLAGRSAKSTVMCGATFTSGPRGHLIMVGSILAATLLAPTEVSSDPGSKTRPAKTYYQGAFWSTQVHVGITSAGDGASVGPALGASFRLASILSLADLQLTVLGAKYMLARKNEAEVRVQRMSQPEGGSQEIGRASCRERV